MVCLFLPIKQHRTKTNTTRMDFDFRLARANDFSGAQEIFTHYVNNTRMAPASEIASAITRLQQSLGFPEFSNDNDETPAYPIYLPAPMVVARRIMLDGSEEPKVVGYAYMGPTQRRTDDSQSSMELFLFVHPDYVRRGIGGALLSMLLNLVHSDLGLRCYDWVLMGPYNSVHIMRRNVKICRIVAAVTIHPETEDGGSGCRCGSRLRVLSSISGRGGLELILTMCMLSQPMCLKCDWR